MAHILVLDDDPDLRDLLTAALQRDGHQVTALEGGSALTPAHCRWADCILLDVMMPGEDGFALCRRIRDRVDCPILFLTAKNQEADILTGLGLGGDDYLLKPFHLSELRARVNAHLRREQRTPRSRMAWGELSFDMGARELYCGDTQVKLTPGEYGICEYLAVHMGQTLSKEQIYEGAFGYDGTAEDSTVTEHIKNIRAKLRQVGQEPIKTVWGVGYQWQRPDPKA